MIHYIRKDITDVDRGVVGHGCNISGGFGSGVAKSIKEKWPGVHDMYKQTPGGSMKLGTIQVMCITDGLYVANMFTQIFYGRDGKKYAVEPAIESTLRKVCNHAQFFDLEVYIPKIGCGLGGLKWETEVKPIVEKIADEFPATTINVCEI